MIMRTAYRIFKPLLILIIALFAQRFLSVASLFINKSSQTLAYSINIALYTTLFGALFAFFEYWYHKQQLDIEIWYFEKLGNRFNETVLVSTDAERVGYFSVQINIIGNIRKHADSVIVFELSPSVQIQSNRFFIGNVSHNTYRLNLKEIQAKHQEHFNLKLTFSLLQDVASSTEFLRMVFRKGIIYYNS